MGIVSRLYTAEVLRRIEKEKAKRAIAEIAPSPHQGKREIERRRKRLAAQKARQAVAP